jgi:hypothetical protein
MEMGRRKKGKKTVKNVFILERYILAEEFFTSVVSAAPDSAEITNKMIA